MSMWKATGAPGSPVLKLAPPKYRVSRPRPGPETLHCDGEDGRRVGPCPGQ